MTTPRRKKATPKRVTKAKRSSRKTLSPFKKRLAVAAAALVIIAGVSLTLIPNAWNTVKNAVGLGSPRSAGTARRETKSRGDSDRDFAPSRQSDQSG